MRDEVYDRAVLVPLRAEHLDRMEELEHLCFSVPWSRADLEDELRNPCAYYIICELDGVAVGYVGTRIVPGSCDITNVAVDPACRRHGLAEKMLTALLAELRTRDVQQLLLEVREHNAAAIALYEKMGFRVIGRRKRYYELPEEDALLMARTLEGKA